MKKVLFVLIVLFIAGNVHAQGIPLDFGVRMAMGNASVSESSSGADQQFRLAFVTGFFASYMIIRRLAILGEFNYALKGTSYESKGPGYTSSSTYAFHYLTLNLLARYFIIRQLALTFGPQLGFLLSANNSWEDSYMGNKQSGDSDIKDQMKTFEMGLVIGVAYGFSFGLMLDLRYNPGLTKIWDTNNSDAKNQAILFGASFALSKLFTRR